MNRIVFLTFFSVLLYSCDKSSSIELEPEPLKINAGNDIILQDEFSVVLKADSIEEQQVGEWNIVSGLVDDKVYIEDKYSNETLFYGLPGENYLLTWTVHDEERKAVDSVIVSFKPLVVKVECDLNPNYSTRRHIWVNSEYEGQWLIQGDLHRYESTQLGGVIVPKEKFPSIVINGKENGIIKAIWKIQYGSVHFSDTLTINTGEYVEYEALEDLGLLNRPNYYSTEGGHVTRICMNHGRGWMFQDLDYFPSLKALKHLRHLDCSGERLNEFPIVISSYYKNLETLDLSSNFITELPENIGNLKNLKVLQLFANDIKKLPDGIGGLESLVELDLISSTFSELPETFGNLQNLEYLTIADLNLTSLPNSFGNLKSLKYFHVGSVKDKLPESFCNLTNLEDLYITYFNEYVLNSLPEDIGNLKRLKRLKIMGYNTFDKLPSSFCNLDSLQEIEIMSTLKELPDNFWHMKSIKKIRLSNTELINLPNNFPLNSSLESLYIYLSKKHYISLPTDIHLLSKLNSLELSGGKVSSVPDNIGKLNHLKYLSFSECDLETVSASIGDLENLEDLILAYNNISKLPESFKNLNSLDYLNICGCSNLIWQIEEIKNWFPYVEISTCL